VERSSKSYNLPLLFAALADSTRLRLLNLMNGREVCVCYFVQILSQSQPKISRHLAYLRRAGIVAARREGKWMHYRIVPPAHVAAAAILREALAAIAPMHEMQRDQRLLNQACCTPHRLALSDRAPVPTSVNA
jgi:ArsR family transcriptional regulator, arsenate/arsenite/antimonite-responsive transcriptional repressor